MEDDFDGAEEVMQVEVPEGVDQEQLQKLLEEALSKTLSPEETIKAFQDAVKRMLGEEARVTPLSQMNLFPGIGNTKKATEFLTAAPVSVEAKYVKFGVIKIANMLAVAKHGMQIP